MKVCGVIVEYNPFHNGHIYHLQKARQISRCDLLVAVMSPYFVQRGEPAIADKWSRARTAIAFGADIVFELPTLHAVQSAAFFADAGVELLAKARADTIVFGSECNDIEKLKTQAKALDHISLSSKRESNIRQYEKALGTQTPNDILAVNYIRAAARFPHINLLSIQRSNEYHSNDITSSIASATAIRHHYFSSRDIHAYTPMAAELNENSQIDQIYPFLRDKLLLDDVFRMKQMFLMDEGIESLLKNAAASCDTYDDFIHFCTNARYTRSRIQRTLIHYLLNTTKDDANAHKHPECLRLLAFRRSARPLLREIQDNNGNVVSRFGKLPSFYQEMERKAVILYTHNDPKRRKILLKREVEGPVYDDHDNH